MVVSVLLMVCATSVSAIKCHVGAGDEYMDSECGDATCMTGITAHDGIISSQHL